ncbi:MAG: hypothetical protein ACUVQ7_01290 [bacterium]
MRKSLALTAGFLIIAVGVGLICGIVLSAQPASESAKPIPEGLFPYLVQMHLHGLSNHNGNQLPASMESQSYEARRNGFDVIWWSDHSRIFESYRGDKIIDFTSALLEGDQSIKNKFTIRLGGIKRGLSLLSATSSGAGCRLEIGRGLLFVVFDKVSKGPCERRTVLRTSSSIGKIKQLDFSRPVVTGLEFRLWGDFDELLAGRVHLKIGFDLSWHPSGQHHLVFEIGKENYRERVIGDTLAILPFVVDSAGSIKLDLEKGASLLPMGYDNSLSDIWIELSTSKCAACTVSIDSFAIHSGNPSGEDVYRVIKELAKEYEAKTGVIQHVGFELGDVHRISNPHINVFLPESTMGLWVAEEYHSKPLMDFVERVHERGGLVSFNHPFGASRMDRSGRVFDDEDLYGASPITLWKSGLRMDQEELNQIAAAMIENQAFQADILEVGYLFRGKGALQDHLRLWDILLSNGLRIIGNGVSDSHGGFWEREMVPSNFATWIWAYSCSTDDLLDGLKKGRSAFGDPFLWRGRFCFGIEDAMMGDTLFVDDVKDLHAWLLMEPALEDASVQIVQVMINHRKQIDYVRNDRVAGLPDHIAISAVTPSYVRLEIYDGLGNPVVFSNPVFLFSKHEGEN